MVGGQPMNKERAQGLVLRAGDLLARVWFSSHRESPDQPERGGRALYICNDQRELVPNGGEHA